IRGMRPHGRAREKPMRKTFTAMAAALALIVAAPAFADGPGDAGPDVAAPPVGMEAQPQASDAANAPQGRSGVIPLSDEVSLNVPESYRYYAPAEAHAFLQRNNAAAPS